MKSISLDLSLPLAFVRKETYEKLLVFLKEENILKKIPRKGRKAKTMIFMNYLINVSKYVRGKELRVPVAKLTLFTARSYNRIFIKHALYKHFKINGDAQRKYWQWMEHTPGYSISFGIADTKNRTYIHPGKIQ